ncbi:hypothetical protein ACIO8H_13125 [Streptomyces sp. NPDC087226]|uniref:hypothetical protein n=1 Tax=Streptomyces sp. NPDC087226 TaxID=3365771 RepID=UPI00380DAF2A
MAEGRAKDIPVLLSHRGVEVTDGDRDRIADCGDPDVLSLRFTRAITATSAAEVFADTTG